MNSLKSDGKWVKKNWYYHEDLVKFYKFNIPPHSTVLEIGTEKKIQSRGKFDYIILSDSISLVDDVQDVFHKIKDYTRRDTRIIINYQNFLWLPFLNIAEKLKLKSPSNRVNWLNTDDLRNLLSLEGFEVIKQGRRFLFPLPIPIISNIINKYLAPLPIINNFCLINFIIARNVQVESAAPSSVSVIVPARNEKGNIENLVRRIPKMGKMMEIIFVEGHSNDKTFEEIKRVIKKYKDLHISVFKQKGYGKADAVRMGFSKAYGNILLILDADLTVPPEDLPKFYEALSKGTGELVNGSRLVYPMEKEAMRTLNIFGNKFFSVLFSWLLNQHIKDTLCGTKAISKRNYQKIRSARKYFGDFDPFGDFDLIFGASKLNLKIIEIPIRYEARKYGKTNISRLAHGWLLLKMSLFALNKIKFI